MSNHFPTGCWVKVDGVHIGKVVSVEPPIYSCDLLHLTSLKFGRRLVYYMGFNMSHYEPTEKEKMAWMEAKLSQ